MPNAITDYGAAQWAGAMFGLATLPGTWYIALCNSEPGTAWDGTLLQDVEVSGQDGYAGSVYQRQAIARGSSAWTLSDSGFVTNSVTLDFGVPDVSWGLVTHFAMADAQLTGNLWCFGEFAIPQEFSTSFDVQIPAGSIVLQLSNLLSSIAV